MFGRGAVVDFGAKPVGPPPVRSTAGQLIYAIGDIHGCYDLLKKLLAQIANDYPTRAAGRRPILVFCGDYIDRGPDSASVLEAMNWLEARPDLEVHLLKGNHEQAMAEFIETPETGGAWLAFGGAETLTAYGVDPPGPEGSSADLIRARDELMRRMPAAHLKLLENLELMIQIGDYAFVHAGVRPGKPLARQSENDLLWIRRGFLDAAPAFDKVIVHGHTWIEDRPQILEHRIGVDTGAYATGALSAVRLDGEDLTIFQAIGVRGRSLGGAPALGL